MIEGNEKPELSPFFLSNELKMSYNVTAKPFERATHHNKISVEFKRSYNQRIDKKDKSGVS